jgi:hypothetical protein
MGGAKKLTCCSSVRSSVSAYCDGAQTVGIEALVMAARDVSKSCADTNCLSISSSSTLGVPMLLPALAAALLSIKYLF